MSKMIHIKGIYSEWLMPEKLYHGTTDVYLENLMLEGLKINNDNKNSALSRPFVYLTSSIEMAKSFAQSVAFRKGGSPIILEVDSTTLEADYIGFDLNISLRLCTQCMTYQKRIPINNVIKELENIGEAKMLFNEPEDLNIPVVWKLNEQRTREHLKRIGYEIIEEQNNDGKNKLKI